MAYQSGDDPLLLSDLRAALKRWHRPTLGETALAGGLAGVERRLAAGPGLSRANALRQLIRTALSSLENNDRAQEAGLLNRRYLQKESVNRLTATYNLSERSIYLRLHEAHLALAHALWHLETAGAGTAQDALPVQESSQGLSKARHLPPRTSSHLFGMDQVLAQLLDYLEDRTAHWVISLDGMAGLGKTAVAREATGRLAETDRFSDIAWVTVRPVSHTPHEGERSDWPALTCGQVLDSITSQLGGVALGPLPMAAKRDRARELLRDSACLVVLDNLETAMDCGTWEDWFWDMAEPSKFLLTSRHWIESDVGPTVISLDQLAEPDGLGLVRHEARLRGLRGMVEASDEALRPILVVTGGNPLAIKLVVGQLLSLPLDHVLAALKTVQPGTSAFYEHLFRISWELVSTRAQHLLRRLARLQAGSGTWSDLLAASDLSDVDLASAIEELTTHSLLQPCGFEEKTYNLHPLTYHFAASQAVLEGEADGSPWVKAEHPSPG